MFVVFVAFVVLAGILITMEVLQFLFVFILGASVGSFVNVLIDRLPRRQDVFLTRSICESCKKKLFPWELVPIVSYLILRAKCKKCKKKIPARIFAVELICGLSYSIILSLHFFGVIEFVNVLYLLVMLPIFIGIIFTDFEFGIIPDEFILSLVGISSVYLAFFQYTAIVNHLISGIGILLGFLMIFVATSGRGMGFGDVKLSFALGLFLGFPYVLISLYLAFLTGATVAIILVLWGKKKLKGDTIPFGPFLAVSSIATYFFGNVILSYIIKILGV